MSKILFCLLVIFGAASAKPTLNSLDSTLSYQIRTSEKIQAKIDSLTLQLMEAHLASSYARQAMESNIETDKKILNHVYTFLWIIATLLGASGAGYGIFLYRRSENERRNVVADVVSILEPRLNQRFTGVNELTSGLRAELEGLRRDHNWFAGDIEERIKPLRIPSFL